MQPAKSSPISHTIPQLQHSNPKFDIGRANRDLILRESQLQREKDEISRQLQNSLKDNSILSKEIQQWKKDHGALLLGQHEAHQELIHLRQEFDRKLMNSTKEVEILKKQCGNLSHENGELMGEIRVLRTEIRVLLTEKTKLEEEKVGMGNLREELERKLTKEVEILKKKCGDLSQEIRVLQGEKTKVEEEKVEMVRREKEARMMCEKLKEELDRVEKCKKEEVEKTIEKKKKVEGNYEAVMIAATDRYNELELRVRKLEEIVEAISKDSAAVQPNAEAEEQQNEVLAAQESAPCTLKSVGAPPPIFEITDSDDEEDLPFVTGTKRKLFLSPEHSDEKEESANSGTDRSKQLKASGDGSVNASIPLVAPVGGRTDTSSTSKSTQNPMALKQCENKPGVELAGKHQGLSTRSDVNDCKDGTQDESDYQDNWEYEADLLDALGRDTELCMKAVCALYRQQTAKGRSIAGQRGFNMHSTLRIAVLAKILANGDEQGRLRRSVTELARLNPQAINECRSIACAHAAQLFEIYQKKTDPFFGP